MNRYGGVLAILAFVAVPQLRADLGFSITDLGNFGGSFGSFTNFGGNGLNGAAQAVGGSYAPGNSPYNAFFYNGTLNNLGSLGGNSSAYGVNSSGQVVGCFNCDTNSQAFRYSNGQMTALSAPGVSFTSAFGINDSSQIVGQANITGATGGAQAYLYSGGNVTDIGAGAAQAINNAGQVTGYINAAGTQQAFLYSNGSLTNLTQPPGTLSSVGWGINSNGDVVGEYTNATSEYAFLYTNGMMTNLGTLQGGSSVALGVNSSDEVVGTSDGDAFVYLGGTMTDLNSFVAGSGWVLQSATAINDLGYILGTGINPSGQEAAFLLTPSVPESGFLFSLLALLGAVATLRLRIRA